MTYIANMIEICSDKLDEAAVSNNPRLTEGHLVLALADLLEVVKRQEERTQRIAAALDVLASKISFLSTSPTEVREQVQAIARLIRDERQE